MPLLPLFRTWALSVLTAGRQRLAGESGQGAVEYVGIVIVVVAVIAALAVFGPEIGNAIGEGLRRIVTDFVGG